VLARHVLGWDRAQLLSHYRDAAPADFSERYQPWSIDARGASRWR
jgi:hypothetical protein